MTTSELISYIEKQIQNNVSKDLIIAKLIGVGWKMEDINEGFLSIDKYREPIDESSVPLAQNDMPGVEMFDINGKKQEIKKEASATVELPQTGLAEVKTPEIIKIELPQGETPKEEKPKVEVIDIKAPEISSPKTDNPTPWFPQRSEIRKIENQAGKISEVKNFNTAPYISPKVEAPKAEGPKVWTPMSIPIREITKAEQSSVNISDDVAVQNKEIAPAKDISQEMGYFTKKEEPTPVSTIKTAFNSFDSIKKDNFGGQNINLNNQVPTEDPQKSSLMQNLPKVAILSTYQKDMISASQKLEENNPQKSHKAKWIIIILFILAVIGVGVWVFASGYINVPFVKKDPKSLLLENSKILSSLKSYKTETNIEITSPSFANISAGLLTGEAITSPDKDSISVNVLGIMNKEGKNLLSDNFITIKGSVLQDYIVSDIKNDGTNLYVSVPDLSKITKEKIPESSAVKINEQEFTMIPDLFSIKTANTLKKLNLYKILSSGLPSYINNDVLSSYNDFVNSVEIVNKGEDSIKGVNTYHYLINTNRELAKNLLKKISDNLTLNLSNGDQEKLTEILGTVTVDSFDVWVGKGDNNIYQYSVVLSVPLSKIIGFEDKSIGDNKVSVSLKTTYYDFNISNNVFIPDSSTTASDFVNQAKIEKMKEAVVSFKKFASDLAKAEVTYGWKPNASGSCMNPTGGSLFSPIGHNSKSTSAVSSISSLLNNVLGATNGNGYCYSTPKAWLLAIPVSNSYDPASVPTGGYTSFFCSDSTGAALDISVPPTGTTCVPKTETPKTNPQ